MRKRRQHNRGSREAETSFLLSIAETVKYGNPFPFNIDILFDSLASIQKSGVARLVQDEFHESFSHPGKSTIVKALMDTSERASAHTPFAKEIFPQGLLILKLLEDQSEKKNMPIAYPTSPDTRYIDWLCTHSGTVEFASFVNKQADLLQNIDATFTTGIRTIGAFLLTDMQETMLNTAALIVLAHTNPSITNAVYWADRSGSTPTPVREYI